MDEIALMESIAALHRRRAAQRLKPFAITLLQYRLILLARRRGPVSLSCAAAELGCDRPGMTLVARACVRAGWLSRRRSNTDRRSARLELTGEGEELLDAIDATIGAGAPACGGPFDVLAPEERRQFLDMLMRVHARACELSGRGATRD